MLLGLYQPLDGSIYINGRSLTDYNPELLKQTVGYVSQESQLFAGTIKENLLFVKPDATDAEMLSVLASAQIKKLIQDSPA